MTSWVTGHSDVVHSSTWRLSCRLFTITSGFSTMNTMASREKNLKSNLVVAVFLAIFGLAILFGNLFSGY